MRFPVYLATRAADGAVSAGVVDKGIDDLPAGDVLIRVAYSSLNYKDALSATGHPGVTRVYPHVPGIDAAGVVAQSRDARFHDGDAVLVTGYDLGVNTWGGFAGYVRVPAEWVVSLPQGLTLREAMILGTAGFTAALSVDALRTSGIADDQPVLVTGGSGGVGSVAVAILAKLGYAVTAVTGKPDAAEYLRGLGARAVIARDELGAAADKGLLPARWGAAVDTAGGIVLDAVLKGTCYGGAVAACGLVAGAELHTHVYPFILRGVRLLGIDSVACPMERRRSIWARLAGEWKPPRLDAMTAEITLDGLDAAIARMLKGGLRGRIFVIPDSPSRGTQV